ncbi:MAG TPA: SurA N-terminal domain-containing protein [Burkholderiales bacterium]|jgi:peptidyl-prolyl cis-trans isomerase D|nr:SurA N-terminal domain-containing protein [Burkholderiales bacterium]
MFDFVARHKRILQLILALTFVPFAFFGLESYTSALRGSGDVATVEGMSISQREFNDELRQYLERLRDQVGQNIDLAELDTPQLRASLVESMIARRLVLARTAKERMTLPREQVVKAILASPEFQADGKFSPERYAVYLRSRGLSDEGNVERLRMEIPAARLANAITGSAFVPRSVAERLVALQGERREVSQATLTLEPFLDKVKPTEDEAKKLYEANLDDYRVPERIKAEYLVLSAQELGQAEAPTDAEVKAAYDERVKQGQLTEPEQRRASHILVKTKEEADRIAAEVKQSPQRFAELAKKDSLDTGSAAQGGDLGMNPKGGLAAKPLDEAVFRMKQGDIDVVQSEFGYHVVRLDTIQPAKTRSFDEMKKDLTAEIAKQKGMKRFTEAAEGFNNTVYEQSDSLKPAADKFKLKPRTTGWITRQPTPEMGPLAHPKLLAALFSQDAIKDKRNTDAIEVAPGVIVAARVTEHEPAKQKPFAEVKDEVMKRLAQQKAAELAQKEGAAKLAELQKGGGDGGLQWAAPRTVSRREATGLTRPALQKIMAADSKKLPAYVGMSRGEQGYVIYRVSKVLPAEAPKEAEKNQDIARLDQLEGAQELEAYIGALRADSKVEIHPAALEKKQ